jgi:hypothetical protein
LVRHASTAAEADIAVGGAMRRGRRRRSDAKAKCQVNLVGKELQQ